MPQSYMKAELSKKNVRLISRDLDRLDDLVIRESRD